MWEIFQDERSRSNVTQFPPLPAFQCLATDKPNVSRVTDPPACSTTSGVRNISRFKIKVKCYTNSTPPRFPMTGYSFLVFSPTQPPAVTLQLPPFPIFLEVGVFHYFMDKIPEQFLMLTICLDNEGSASILQNLPQSARMLVIGKTLHPLKLSKPSNGPRNWGV